MSQFSLEDFSILFKKKWPAKRLAQLISDCDRDALCDEYKELKRSAPRRANRCKRYFVDGHTGEISTPSDGKNVDNSNRFEERLAIAI